ncbi:chondroitin sulfate synthase 2 [Macrosteles quadrilineatus]|uniref:chondroitin sulfate synthase 2 n=1 Tax=Macrosteles quadrilineatus TaxID=74068 RepID=UPI0023E1D785|nr:chondroitin sulfate synthase 2 [Macrosteles quadrilineatus]XP_054269457.1 chondroitin sulfate synthase 2 [Macrosteles quadrilineatus]
MFRILHSVVRQNACFVLTFILGFCLSVFIAPILVTKDCGQANVRFTDENTNRKLLEEVDVYEPKINLAAKPKIASKPSNGMIRPRFHKAELGIRNKLFLGILTSPDTISTLAVALNKTTSQFVYKIMYFIDAPSAQRLNVSKLKLPGIVGFTDTRKSLKPFHLVKYISDNFLEDYDYFFIIKDTSYIHGQRLVEFTKQISIQHDVHIGQIVKTSSENKICSLDSGILLSNSVIRKMQKLLEWCVKNLPSKDDNVNFGECVIHASNVPCSSVAQGSTFNTYSVKNSKSDFKLPTIEKEMQKFDQSIVISPVLKDAHLFLIHFYFSQAAVERLNTLVEELRQEVVMTGRRGEWETREWPIASQPAASPTSHFDVVRWEHFTTTHKYLPDDFTNMAPLSGADEEDIQRVIKRSIAYIENKYDGALKFHSFINGYQKFDPSRGMDYIIDLAFRETTSGKTINKRLEVFKSLGKVEMVPVPYVTENVRVHLIIPVRSSDQERILTFLKQYSVNAMEKKDLQFLMMVFIYSSHESSKGEDDVFKQVKQKALVLSNKFEKVGNLIKWHSIKLPTNMTTFPTEALLDFAVMDSVLKKFTSDSLILFGRPNMEVRLDYFNRVRMNTVSGFQVFSPIPFAEYQPEIVYNEDRPQPPELDINKNYGHYDSLNFRHISFYTSDYTKARKEIENTVPIVKYDKDIWKLVPKATVTEDSQLYSYMTQGIYAMLVSHSAAHVMRAVEPSLRLRHAGEMCATCDYCSQTQAFNLAPRSLLGRLLLDYQAEAGSVK